MLDRLISQQGNGIYKGREWLWSSAMHPAHRQLAQMVLQMYICSSQPKATILINSNVIKCCRERVQKRVYVSP